MLKQLARCVKNLFLNLYLEGNTPTLKELETAFCRKLEHRTLLASAEDAVVAVVAVPMLFLYSKPLLTHFELNLEGMMGRARLCDLRPVWFHLSKHAGRLRQFVFLEATCNLWVLLKC